MAGNCLNCGAALTGPFCRACGQSAHVHRSLLHLGEELLHGVLHFDAKAWRTLPLLVFKPGTLTRRYIDGQRARHVSPLALFLFSVFLMFFAFSFGAVPPVTVIETTSTSPSTAATRETALGAGASVAASAPASSASAVSGTGVVAPRRLTVGTALPLSRWRAESPRLDAAIERARANPDLLLYRIKAAASKFSFMLIPLSLPFLWLMFFRRRGVTAYDHAVFALYSLSFMSVLAVVAAGLAAAGAPTAWLLAVPPLHMYAQLKGSYGLTRWQALWRTAALLLMCLMVCALFAAFVLLVTMG